MTHAIVALTLWAALALVAISQSIPLWAILLIGLIFTFLTFVLPENRRALTALLALSFLLSGNSLLVQTAENKPEWINQVIKREQLAEIEVEILNRPKEIYLGFGGQPNFGVSVALKKYEGKSATGRGYLIYRNQQFTRGQQIAFQAKLEPPGTSARDAFSVRPTGEVTVTKNPEVTLDFLGKLRENYSRLISGVTPDAKVLVAGLAIGEVGELSKELSEQMRSVSLTHLVAVSGSNCAIVVGLFYLISVRLRLGTRGRTIFSLVALLCYVALIGPDPSVLRAGIMATAVIVSLALGRRGWAINSLAISATILLIADPWLALEYGFGLSVLATAGILLLAPALAKKLETKIPKLLALALAVTISAQLLCLPLLLQLQPGLATYSIFANLLAGPAVAPVTVLGIVAVILTPIAPSLVGPISYLASFGTAWIESVAIFFSELPVTFVPWFTGGLAAVMSTIVIALVAIWLKASSPAVKSAGVSGLVIFAVATLSAPAAAAILPSSFPVKDWQLVACDVGQGDALLLRSAGRVALIDVGPNEQLIDSCLAETGVSHIDLLVLTHFDFDHVGGLGGALKGRTLGNAMISGFPDDRPATKLSKELLASKGVEPIVANIGMSGQLGDFDWRVLSPTREAGEAKDSNDASVVMHFSSPDLQVLLLGDLGADGQDRIYTTVLAAVEKLNSPLALKVSHHGSNDQSESFHLALRPKVAIFSVGVENGYGHPGRFALDLFDSSETLILRTDKAGAVSLSGQRGYLSWAATGG